MTHRALPAITVVAAAVASIVLPLLHSQTLPVAEAASCPPVEVVFARGRNEPPGAGLVGDAFVNSLRGKTKKTIGLYAVNYPADTQIDMGAADMSRHVQYMATNCPTTRMVLGGYSLGAAATDLVLALPVSLFAFTNPLPPGTDQHIAAVVLFGNGSNWAGPISGFNPIYAGRTIDLCHGDDPICNPSKPSTWTADFQDHLQPGYINSGMVAQAASFAAARI
ncbi:MAG: cutinase family protein [Mycobacterium sp.]